MKPGGDPAPEIAPYGPPGASWGHSVALAGKDPGGRALTNPGYSPSPTLRPPASHRLRPAQRQFPTLRPHTHASRPRGRLVLPRTDVRLSSREAAAPLRAECSPAAAARLWPTGCFRVRSPG